MRRAYIPIMSKGDQPLPAQAGRALLSGAMAFGAALLLLGALFAPLERIDTGARQAFVLQAASAPVSVRAGEHTPLATVQRALGQWTQAGGQSAALPPALWALIAPAREGRLFAAAFGVAFSASPPRAFNARAPPHLRAA